VPFAVPPPVSPSFLLEEEGRKEGEKERRREGEKERRRDRTIVQLD
jgi:hypothetical protein